MNNCVIAEAGTTEPCSSRYAALPGEYEMLLACVKFDSTGQYVLPIPGQQGDLIWSYAISVVRFNPTTRKARVVDLRRRVIKITKGEKETYEELYIRMGWEMRCLTEFLMKQDPETGEQPNLKAFEALQKIATLNNSKELAILYNQDLHDIEHEVGVCNGVNDDGSPKNFEYGWCTMEHDPLCAAILCAIAGVPTMARWRCGVYHGGGHYYHSYLCGMAGINMNDVTWEKTKELTYAINAEARKMVASCYDPGNDATYTCIRFYLTGLIARKV